MKSTGASALSLKLSSLRETPDPFDEPGMRKCTRSDVYARPDVYDMEYAGASNQTPVLRAAARAASAPRVGHGLRIRPRHL